MGILLLTAVCAYGYKVTNVTIGIDDTPSLYYFEEGLIAIVGRWVLFLLNKVIFLAEFVPFVTDFIAVCLLVLAAIVWTVLFYSVLGEKIPVVGYAFFAVIFVSSPLISEVFTYFLHNGIAIGYLCCGLSLCCVREWQVSIRKMQKGSGIREKFDCLAVMRLVTAAADRDEWSLPHTGGRSSVRPGSSDPQKADDRCTYQSVSVGIFTGRSGATFGDGDVRLDVSARSLQ